MVIRYQYNRMVCMKLSNLYPACIDLVLALPMLAKATCGIRLPHLQKVGQWASPTRKEKTNIGEP